jgi:hypothetical protein
MGNVKVLCAVRDFGDETFNLPQTLIRNINLNKPPQPLLHKTRVISWLRLIKTKAQYEAQNKRIKKKKRWQKWI